MVEDGEMTVELMVDIRIIHEVRFHPNCIEYSIPVIVVAFIRGNVWGSAIGPNLDSTIKAVTIAVCYTIYG